MPIRRSFSWNSEYEETLSQNNKILKANKYCLFDKNFEEKSLAAFSASTAGHRPTSCNVTDDTVLHQINRKRFQCLSNRGPQHEIYHPRIIWYFHPANNSILLRVLDSVSLSVGLMVNSFVATNAYKLQVRPSPPYYMEYTGQSSPALKHFRPYFGE